MPRLNPHRSLEHDAEIAAVLAEVDAQIATVAAFTARPGDGWAALVEVGLDNVARCLQCGQTVTGNSRTFPEPRAYESDLAVRTLEPCGCAFDGFNRPQRRS